ncbi:MAG: zf-HC2 domain-containing protein [Planctomycetaceae bacterium]|nr:zf-HC2 domain-containing protein [Planctomycetaceae bacterium]
MNDCSKTPNVSAYHDGELTPQAQADFESHLAACESCSRQLDRLRQLTALLRRVEAPAADGQLLDRLHVHADTLPRVGAVRRLAQTLAAVAAGIVVVCAVALTQGSPAPAEAAPAWESEALTPPSPETAQVTSEAAMAGWVLQDLAGKD